MSYIINSLIKIYTEIALGQNIQTIETKKTMLKDASKCQGTVCMVVKVASIHSFSPSRRAFSLLFTCYEFVFRIVLEVVKKYGKSRFLHQVLARGVMKLVAARHTLHFVTPD